MIYDFSNLDRDECLSLIALARVRLHHLTQQQPLVWGVKRILKGHVKYSTRVAGYGWRQVMAFSTTDPALRLYSTEQSAIDQRDAMAKESKLNDVVFEVYTLCKADLPSLPCWETYQKFKTFNVELDKP